MKLHPTILFSFCLITTIYLHGADNSADYNADTSAIDKVNAQRHKYIKSRETQIQGFDAEEPPLRDAFMKQAILIDNKRQAAIATDDALCKANGRPIDRKSSYRKKAKKKHAEEIQAARANLIILESRRNKARREMRRLTKKIAQSSAPATIPEKKPWKWE